MTKRLPMAILILSGLFALSLSECRRQPSTSAELEIDSQPFGLQANEVEQLRGRLLAHPDFERAVGDRNYRLLSFALVDDNLQDKLAEIEPPSRVRGIFYDYTRNQPFEVASNLALDRLEFRDLDYQPVTSGEEFDEAARILIDELNLAGALEEGDIQLYEAMPGATATTDGHRTVIIGLHSQTPLHAGTVYGVDMIDRVLVANILDYLEIDPNLFEPDPCEIAEDDSCPSTGTSGMVHVTVKQGGQTLWTFYAVRPAASSGHPSKGSALEVRYVRYKGKLVLWRGHLPILNVQYQNDFCGPYRDWQNEENCFNCSGTDVGNTGFRICNQEPTTIVETRSDSGNFRGVGIFVKGQEVLLRSEINSAWYRYVTEWKFHANGTIKPRFKFDAVKNHCTCHLHFHNAYFRFDFDIRTPGSNTVEEYVQSGGGWSQAKVFTTEGKSYRDKPRKWRARNGEDFYEVVPGPHDGDASGNSFQKGDVWVVRYRSSELEDGVSCISCSTGSPTCPYDKCTIQESAFVNAESVDERDVVMWYRGSYRHDPASGAHVHGEETVGPDLVPSPGFGN